MKNRKLNIVFAIIVIMATSLLVVVIFFQRSDNQPIYHWRKTYESDQKNPYDTFVMYNLLKNSSSTGQMIDSEKSFKHFSWLGEEPLNYIFIGDQAYYTGQDAEALLKFVEEGNNVFLAQEYVDDVLFSKAMGYDSTDMYLQSTYSSKMISCTYNQDCFTFNFSSLLSDSAATDWYFFADIPDDDRIERIGNLGNKEVNLLKVKYGEGDFYFHSTPLLFTNYYMSDSLTWNYANMIFSVLPGHNFYWDKHAYFNIAELSDDIFQNPLKHILGNKSFMWAWYWMLIVIIAFIILNSKRRQRSIPLIDPNENSTIEFTETIGQLYFKEQNHVKLIKLMIQMFLFNLYIRYKIPIHKTLDKKTLSKLAKKTGVSPEHMDSILHQFKSIEGDSYAKGQDLISLYKKIYKYRNECK